MTGIYELTLRASDGRERRTLAWLPTEAIKQDFYEKARRNGIEIIINNQLNELNELTYDRKLDSCYTPSALLAEGEVNACGEVKSEK